MCGGPLVHLLPEYPAGPCEKIAVKKHVLNGQPKTRTTKSGGGAEDPSTLPLARLNSAATAAL